MTIHGERRRSSGLGAMGVLLSVLLLVGVGIAMIYRLSTGGSRPRAMPTSAPLTESSFVSRQPPRAVWAPSAVTAPVAARAPSPSASPPESKSRSKDDPFIEARQERRDSVWALQTESGVRNAIEAFRDKNVTLRRVQCASIRCTLEGTIGQGGTLHDVVRALHDVGLPRGRFKRVRGDDGTMTFSAVFSRTGYELDGTRREAVAKAP